MLVSLSLSIPLCPVYMPLLHMCRCYVYILPMLLREYANRWLGEDAVASHRP